MVKGNQIKHDTGGGKMDINTAKWLIGLVVWIWLSSLVARYVGRRGGSQGAYWALSLILSPVLGFLIASSQWSKMPILDKSKSSWSCRKCGANGHG